MGYIDDLQLQLTTTFYDGKKQVECYVLAHAKNNTEAQLMPQVPNYRASLDIKLGS
ncbi:hypothetical protein HCBG_00201 [Histoplasma capsulatum G186AR]|uniref:Uncharacterized protein n=1 Tax=Ajellomyces capsulatus (strain G186AR / H82 / ATCC MYA-2454 / RMSCC 2432) TaxID=447093 RepID=C0NAQ5_AJECG|nr:uncharacterized protein HCBG_00201 [Histoplasma capsulatum G186AR]EEH10746.1 hypothetical protein HCBG_00201 [Histoplasma capsulatum G186AR]